MSDFRTTAIRKGSSRHGGSAVEFVFITFTMVPLILGTTVVGLDLNIAARTAEVAREVAHMYGKGLDFSQAGNQSILYTSGSSLGLSSTPGSGTAVVMLSQITYVDTATCALGGAISGGVPSGCTNYGKWVFTQRLVFGNSTVGTSSFGTPSGVTINSTTGVIAASQYVTQSGAVANLNSIKSYSNVSGTISGLPSLSSVYVVEVAAKAYGYNPVVSPPTTYSYAIE